MAWMVSLTSVLSSSPVTYQNWKRQKRRSFPLHHKIITLGRPVYHNVSHEVDSHRSPFPTPRLFLQHLPSPFKATERIRRDRRETQLSGYFSADSYKLGVTNCTSASFVPMHSAYQGRIRLCQLKRMTSQERGIALHRRLRRSL